MDTAPPAHRDRSTSLKVVGLVEILIGAGSALLALATAALAVATVLQPPAASPGAIQIGLAPRAAVPSLSLYLIVAAAFVTLGIGSMRARSWAREYMLPVAWIWLFTGLSSIAVLAFVWSDLVEMLLAMTGLPMTWVVATMLAAFAITTLLHVILPGLLVLFYQHPDVIATCVASESEGNRRASRPTAVLSLSLLYLLLAYSAVLLPVYGLPVPFFGLMLDGAKGLIVVAATVGAYLWLTWASLSRSDLAWWTGVLSTLVVMAATTASLIRHPVGRFVEAMALSPEEIEVMMLLTDVDRTTASWVSALTWLSLLGYQIAVKRHFGDAA